MDKLWYKDVKVYKDRPLGSGAYGTVYHAKCDDLPCAAKVLHSILFEDRNPGIKRILAKFDQEIKFLRQIRHPCIVQYLQVVNDETTKLPILLMEVMEENLTSLLERSLSPLPFCVQVDICYDVALAVAFLHSQDIIHRDLSSNNILVMAGCRAKVTDFGMCRFLKNHSKLTPLPRTAVYMPPETLHADPKYERKIDCFSFGPLIIQIITRLFPKPDPVGTIVNDDPKYPLGVVAIVPETKRRRNHIKLVSKTHPLLSVANECLSNDPELRPDASSLCQMFLQMKQLGLYTKGRCSRCLCFSNEQSPIQSSSSDPSPRYPSDRKRMRNLLGIAPMPMTCGSAAVCGDIAFFRPAKSNIILAFDFVQGEWLSGIPACSQYACTLVTIDNHVTAIGGYLSINNDTNMLLSLIRTEKGWKWEELYPAMPTKRGSTAAVCIGKTLIVAGGACNLNDQLKVVEILDLESNMWYIASELPYPLSEASAYVCDQQVYLIGGWDETEVWMTTILTCSLQGLLRASHLARELLPPELPLVWAKWTQIQLYHFSSFSIEDNLVIVSGKDLSDNRIKDIQRFNYRKNKWEIVGVVSRARTRCLVVGLPKQRVMVVGGRVNEGRGIAKTDMYEIISLSL